MTNLSKNGWDKVKDGASKGKELAVKGYDATKQTVGGAYKEVKVATALTLETARKDLRALTGGTGKVMGALAGHAIQQMASCALPTFSREMLALALQMELAKHPNVVMALQVGATGVNLVLQTVRHRRLKGGGDQHVRNHHKLSPEAWAAKSPQLKAVLRQEHQEHIADEAARGFHGLSKEDWDKATLKSKAAMRERQQRNSRIVTGMQVAGSLTNLSASIAANAMGHPEISAAIVASEVRNWLYAGMRETVNATFRMVGTDPHAASGVKNGDMRTAAALYGGTQMVLNFMAPPILKAMNLSALGPIIKRADGSEVPSAKLLLAGGQVAAVRAALGTLGEIVDAFQLNALEVGKASGQFFEPKRTGVDYARLLDHSPARVTWNTSVGTAQAILSLAPAGDNRSLAIRVAGGMLHGLVYKPISQTYQAQFTVRGVLRNEAYAAEDALSESMSMMEEIKSGRHDLESGQISDSLRFPSSRRLTSMISLSGDFRRREFAPEHDNAPAHNNEIIEEE